MGAGRAVALPHLPHGPQQSIPACRPRCPAVTGTETIMASCYMRPTYVLELEQLEVNWLLMVLTDAIRSIQDNKEINKPNDKLSHLITITDELNAAVRDR